jgi:hypothetical protein
MAYEFDTIQLSQKIFNHLISKGELKADDNITLYKAYVEDENVLNLVKSQAEISDCIIERYGSTIYLMPNTTNDILGYTKAELKKELCKSGGTDKDYYLSQFVIITLMAEFYDGQGSHCKSRTFIKSGELQNIISERLKQGISNEEEKPHTGLDYTSMSEAFEALKSEDRTSRKKTTKEGFINTILSFLEKHGLITYIADDEMIKTTKKLDDIMEMKILNRDNYTRVMNALGIEQ